MAGFRVIEAPDGKAALEALIRCRDEGIPVELVVTDLRMPNLTGSEFVSAMQRIGIRVPVFMISGFCDEPTLRELAEAGCVEYMERPFRPEELVRRIEGILGERAAQA
jgi:DNA-binding response OmpR family regulator